METKTTPHTVLVVGAGASVQYEFPCGAKLIERVKAGLRGIGDRTIRSLITENYRPAMGRDIHKLVEQLAEDLHWSRYTSIDDFLAKSTKELREVAMLAASSILLQCEKEYRKHLKTWDRDWIGHIVDRLFALEGDPVGSVAIVTFNYDRLVELTLAAAIRARATAAGQEKCRWPSLPIEIVHLHGALGECCGPLDLDWWWKIGKDNDYAHIDKVHRAASSIRLYSEATEAEAFKRAKELLRQARRFAFLGFGFHESNVRNLGLIGAERPAMTEKNTWATRRGISDGRIGFMKQDWLLNIGWMQEKADCLGALEQIDLFSPPPVQH
jgi:hypothetical protein